MKKIAILGATGSIGKQTLAVIKDHPNLFTVEILTANNNADLLIQQSLEFKPNAVVIGNKKLFKKVNDALSYEAIKVYAGSESIEQVVLMDSVDMVVTAMVGISGLLPTIRAIESGKEIALANKETLVVAGALIISLAAKHKTLILPVDSEHSAIFQCITGEIHNKISKIFLTASGGPFRGKTEAELRKVTPAQALAHPNWDMGAKISIDSATMMNKGLEAIEAKWLFGLKSDQIEVIVHPQSIIHSMVQFEDSSIKAQLGLPDMRLPIIYALGFPNRIKTMYETLDFTKYNVLHFEKPDLKIFRNLALCFSAMEKGGNMACILNAANEVAVEAFLSKKIPFTKMPNLIEKSMEKIDFIENPSLDDLLNSDDQTRKFIREMIK